MPELRRTIRCSNCGNEISFYLSTDMPITELLLHGKCPQCGNSLQINFSIIEPSQVQQTPSKTSETETINVDESLFESELPSDIIRDLMEE